jgi:hypothetical protein
MTEQEWLTCTDPVPMLEFLRARANDRKLRLLMAAACRRVLHLLDERQYRALVEAGERVADGSLSPASLARYRTSCPPVSHSDLVVEERRWQEHSRDFNGPVLAIRAVWLSGSRDRHRVDECLHYAARGLLARHAIPEEHANQCRLILDIFGNPFCPMALDPAWLRPIVTRLASAVYEERHLPSGELDPARLGVLADALEDAGCDNAELLGHLRGLGPHVRGCWALDLLLGRN